MIITIVGLSPGCSSSPAVQPSITESDVLISLERGLRAAEKEEFEKAEHEFLTSFNLSASIEDNNRKTIALINLARLKRLQNDLDNSAKFIESAFSVHLEEKTIEAERFHELALLEIALKQPERALKNAIQALQFQNDLLKGRERNLIVRCLMLQGKIMDALGEANQAIKENSDASLMEEWANSFRSAGIIKRILKDNETSNILLQKALKIDKELGISSKIALDLEELAQTAESANNVEEAQKYKQRAFEVRQASRKIFQEIPATIRPSSRP